MRFESPSDAPRAKGLVRVANMRIRSAWLIFCVCLSAGIIAADAAGQTPRSYGYQPTRPTISPWMNLYQRNTGAVDNYHTYVQPQKQLQETLQQQNARIQQQGLGIRGLTHQLSDLEQGKTVRATGAGSVFMDYSHYYDLQSAGGTFRPSSSRTSRR